MESPNNNPKRHEETRSPETPKTHPDQVVSHNIQSVRNKLSELFKNGEAVVFAGAGISLEPPAGLPDWYKLRDFTLEAIASRDEFLGQFLDTLASTPMIAAPGKQGLTPEVVASQIVGNCEGYFECFRSLEEGEPNANHRYLAKLTKNRHLQYIFTTNFDLFIEKALEDEGVEFVVHRTEEEFQSFQTEQNHTSIVISNGEVKEPGDPEDKNRVHIFKLHGCISEPSTITATVEQEGRGLPAAKQATLDTLLPTHNFVFWGYSGADLKIDLDYLRMETNQDTAKGFVWNFLQRDDYKEPVNPYVEQLRGMYGDRSQVVHGKLPEVFDEFIDPEERIERTEYTEQQEEDWMEDKNEKLKVALKEWASEHIQQGNACSIFGGLLQHSGNMDEALKCYERCTAVHINADNRQHYLAACLNNIGSIHHDRGDLDQALDYYKQAEEIIRTLGDKKSLTTHLNNIGSVHQSRGDLDQALKYSEEAEEIARALGDKENLATCLNNIGSIHHDREDYDQALVYYKQAEKIRRTLGDKQSLGTIFSNIGSVFYTKGDLDQALDYYKQAEEIDRAFSDKKSLGTIFSNIGEIYKAKGDLDQALDYYKQAEKIRRTLGNEKNLAIALSNIGAIYEAKGDLDQALDYYKQTVEMIRVLGDKKSLATRLNTIGSVSYTKGDLDQALDYFKQSLQIQEELNNISNAAITSKLIGTICFNKLKQHQEAIKYYKISIAHYHAIGNEDEVSKIEKLLENHKKKLAKKTPGNSFSRLLRFIFRRKE